MKRLTASLTQNHALARLRHAGCCVDEMVALDDAAPFSLVQTRHVNQTVRGKAEHYFAPFVQITIRKRIVYQSFRLAIPGQSWKFDWMRPCEEHDDAYCRVVADGTHRSQERGPVLNHMLMKSGVLDPGIVLRGLLMFRVPLEAFAKRSAPPTLICEDRIRGSLVFPLVF